MKKFLYLLLICVGLMALTACGAGNTSAPVSISFLVFGDPAEIEAYEQLVLAFEKQHPEINVELGFVPSQSEYRQKLTASFSAGTPPDVSLMNFRRLAPFAADNQLQPLDDYLAKSQLIKAEDFYSQALDAFTWQEKLWCMPQNVSSLVVYYNKNMFDTAGVAYPQPGWTREQFVETAKALTQDINGDGRTDLYGVGLEASLFRLAPFLWQDGLELVDDPANPTRLTLDSPEALKTLQWFVNLQVVEKVVPDQIAEEAEDSETRFMNGTLAMYFNSRRGVPTYRTITSFEWDIAPLPVGQSSASVLHSDGYCMAAVTAHKDAAWTFIEFANSVEGQTIVAETGRTVPSLKAVAESDSFLDPTKPPASSQIFLDVMPTLRTVPVLPAWVGIEETATQEIEWAFYGKISVEEAAANAIKNTEGLFEEK